MIKLTYLISGKEVTPGDYMVGMIKQFPDIDIHHLEKVMKGDTTNEPWSTLSLRINPELDFCVVREVLP